jgi:hypothetical protein
MELAATEFAAKVPPIRIPRMREEANLTTAAVDRTACQTGMLAQDGIQRPLILTNERTGAVVLMPIPANRKEFADGYDKKAKFSVRILRLFCISPSYSLDAIASRGRPGIFIGPQQRQLFRRWHHRFTRQSPSHRTPLRRRSRLTTPHKFPTWKEESGVNPMDSKTRPNYLSSK